MVLWYSVYGLMWASRKSLKQKLLPNPRKRGDGKLRSLTHYYNVMTVRLQIK